MKLGVNKYNAQGRKTVLTASLQGRALWSYDRVPCKRHLTPGSSPQKSAQENDEDHISKEKLVPALRIWK